MKEKKFYIPSIVISAVAMVMFIFALPVESIAAGIVSLIISMRKRENYRIRAAVAIAIGAIVLSAAFLILIVVFSTKQGAASSNYWLLQLIFGKME